MRLIDRIARAVRRRRQEKAPNIVSAPTSEVFFRETSYQERLAALRTLHTVRSVHTLLAGAAGRLTWQVYGLNGDKLITYSELLDAYAGLLFADWLVLGAARWREGFVRDVQDFDHELQHPAPPLEAASILLAKLYEIERAEYQAFWRQGASVFAVLDEHASYVPTPEETATTRTILQNSVRAAGAGGIDILPIPIRFQEISKGLKDYGFPDQKVHLIRELCNLFAIDSSLLNDPENKTYSNKTEAQKALYINVIIPNCFTFSKSLERYLAGQGLFMRIDIDFSAVESVAELRFANVQSIVALVREGVISPAEAKQLLQL